MTHVLDNQTTPLLVEVSETEQERITAGYGLGGLDFFYFDQINIETSASNETSFSGTDGEGGQVTGTSSSNTAYRLSRTTLAFGGFGGSRYGFSSWMWFLGQGFLARLMG